MAVFIVVENKKQLPLKIPGTEIVFAKDYLTEKRFSETKRAKVFNLCRTYSYQSVGYYVSLLATARGHKPMPSVMTMQDMRESSLVRIASKDLDKILQRSLSTIGAKRFQLSIYFGRNLAKRYDKLAQALFGHFPVPLMRADFLKLDQWRLQNIRLLSLNDIPDNHYDFVIEQAQRFFARPRLSLPKRAKYEIAILYDPDEIDAPSDEKALNRFSVAAKELDLSTTIIGRHDYGRLAEFDGLFIRSTTRVDHYTYRFASRAEAEGLAVIDDPESIIRCSNKVYLAELFEKNRINAPKTIVVHRDNCDSLDKALEFPCVLKRPDSSFSAGVVKANHKDELINYLENFFKDSELIVAQEYLKSDFDWRVGVLNKEALFLCRYHMARGHWQIQKALANNRRTYGKVETIPLNEGPSQIIDLGVQAANLIGNGLYGVDIKEINGTAYVMEVNDNPNIEAGYEDSFEKDVIYKKLASTFLERIENRGRMRNGH